MGSQWEFCESEIRAAGGFRFSANTTLTKIIDPETESRRCKLQRRVSVVMGVEGYHTDADITSHLGTHVEAPSHWDDLTKDVTDLPPDLSRQSAEWFVEKKVKGVGVADGVAIENNAEHCRICHEVMLGNDISFIEVMHNIDKLREDVFLIIYMPLPIRGLDSSPVNVMAIEGIPGFTP